MSKVGFFYYWLLFILGTATLVFSSCGQSTNYNNVVVINGVKWASCNVDLPGTFAATPEAPGMYYQFNRNTGWTFTDMMISSDGSTECDSSIPVGDTWKTANDPSPKGWRVPTYEEIKKLLDTNKVRMERVTENGIDGRRFTDKITGNFIFLPAAGFCDISDCSLNSVDYYGLYWSSTSYDTDFAYYLAFFDENAEFGYIDRRGGFSLRPVAK